MRRVGESIVSLDANLEKQISNIAVIIPCYKVKSFILEVLREIGPEVSLIIIIDDACPEKSGQFILEKFDDPRLVLIEHEFNQGVGGAMITGYKRALESDCIYFVKLDGDGQMDPRQIGRITKPLRTGFADYSKGNRYFDLEQMDRIPRIRLIGNLMLSFLSKFASGYWDIFDPNNGFTAINRKTLESLPLDKVSKRYFFESDMLFRLNLLGAVVKDVPMPPKYGEEVSGLNVFKSIFEFGYKHIRNFMKRVAYNYFLRDFNIASISILIGAPLFCFGLIYGLFNFVHSISLDRPTPPSSLILVSVTVISGIQLLLNFFTFDIQNTPKDSFSRSLEES